MIRTRGAAGQHARRLASIVEPREELELMTLPRHISVARRPPGKAYPYGGVEVKAFTGKAERRSGFAKSWNKAEPVTEAWLEQTLALAEAYVERHRDDVLAGRSPLTRIDRRVGLLDDAAMDAIPSTLRPQKSRRPSPDITWEDCEQLVENDLRAAFPDAFVSYVGGQPGYGCDIFVALEGRGKYVEVKKAHTNVTENERARAIERGEDFVFAIVDRDGVIDYVENPAGTGVFEPVVRTTYRWRPSA